MTVLTLFRTTKEKKRVKVSISYQQQEVDKVLKMESELMKRYGYNRSQLHKALIRERHSQVNML
ncbi:hypothetical protein PMIT1320_00388 [Prochlorococcus marinus str. MIT 1320]|nr:hypothetical protein PMIT1320_00388 [Prochlorococcus marinus str. MIT 1320]